MSAFIPSHPVLTLEVGDPASSFLVLQVNEEPMI